MKGVLAYLLNRFSMIIEYAFNGEKMKKNNINSESRLRIRSPKTEPSELSTSKLSGYKAPGVYVSDASFPTAGIERLPTAVPAFIGYTQKGPDKPTKIYSLTEFEEIFGGPAPELPSFTIDGTTGKITADTPIAASPVYKMYYMLELYFANGGGPCYIMPAGTYSAVPQVSHINLLNALEMLKKEAEPTLVLFADAQSVDDNTDYHNLFVASLRHCSEAGNRFAICDVKPAAGNSSNPVNDAASAFYNHIGVNNLKFGAAYYPNLKTNLRYRYKEEDISVSHSSNENISVLRHTDKTILSQASASERSLFHAENGRYRLLYHELKKMIDREKLELPPSGAVAGAYVLADHSRGVWKSPANISLNSVIEATVSIKEAEQENLTVGQSGKSINAIRNFIGRGTMIWGARTIDGNNSEWRYIAVRRFYSMVEESVKNGAKFFVFEPNDANTWASIKAMVENFLTTLWREGALAGARPEDAFFIKIGLGETMTEQDIKEGRLIIELGMAVLRPAEFIIMRIHHKMVER